MSNDSKHQTLLERLPIEVFLQIFSFLPFSELIGAFSGLNAYIDSVIRSASASQVVKAYEINTINLLYAFPTPIARLVVNAPAIDLTPFMNLRSLTLKYGTQTQFDSIRPQYFPRLEILHIKGFHETVDDTTETINNLFHALLSDGFSCLRICTTFDTGDLAFNAAWTGSTSLRTLIVWRFEPAATVRFHSICPRLRRLTCGATWLSNQAIEHGCRRNRHIWRDFQGLERLEGENKFMIEINSMVFADNQEALPCYYDIPRFLSLAPENTRTFQGRILPQSEPYCRTSFRIQITLPVEYPFKEPEFTFLDPIYHLNIDESGKRCCQCGFQKAKEFTPSLGLAKIVENIIYGIDNPSDYHRCCDARYQEYLKDPGIFHSKALEHTLLYGRPRY